MQQHIILNITFLNHSAIVFYLYTACAEHISILARGEYKVPIMQTIADKAGLQTPAETVVLSLPVV